MSLCCCEQRPWSLFGFCHHSLPLPHTQHRPRRSVSLNAGRKRTRGRVAVTRAARTLSKNHLCHPAQPHKSDRHRPPASMLCRVLCAGLSLLAFLLSCFLSHRSSSKCGAQGSTRQSLRSPRQAAAPSRSGGHAPPQRPETWESALGQPHGLGHRNLPRGCRRMSLGTRQTS